MRVGAQTDDATPLYTQALPPQLPPAIVLLTVPPSKRIKLPAPVTLDRGSAQGRIPLKRFEKKSAVPLGRIPSLVDATARFSILAHLSFILTGGPPPPVEPTIDGHDPTLDQLGRWGHVHVLTRGTDD